MTTMNTMRAVTPPVAAWRDQLPTLIRVYGIILTLVLLVAVVGIGNPAFLSDGTCSTCCRSGRQQGSWPSA